MTWRTPTLDDGVNATFKDRWGNTLIMGEKGGDSPDISEAATNE